MNPTQTNQPQVVISRERYFAHGMNVQWRWLYTVTLPNGYMSTRGTSLAEARSYAKRKAPGFPITTDF